MKRSSKIKWGELKVGLLITFCLVILVWASFSGGGTSIFDRKIKFKAYFNNANGLVSGAPVWLSGVEVGNVKSISFVNLDKERQIEIQFVVVKSVVYMITEDAGVKLGTIGLLGDKYIEVRAGSLDKPQLEEGSVISTIPSGGLSAMFTEGEQMMTSTRELVENLSDVTGKMKQGEGTAGRLFTDDTLFTELTALIASMTVLINDMQISQKKIVNSIESVSSNLDEIAAQVNSNSGTIGKLISDPGVYDNIHSSTGRIDSILTKINRGEGTAGALVNDDELYQEIKNLVVRIENLVADIEQNPRKYFKFSVF